MQQLLRLLVTPFEPFLRIKDLCNKIIKLGRNCNNRNCRCRKRLADDYPGESTIRGTVYCDSLFKEPLISIQQKPRFVRVETVPVQTSQRSQGPPWVNRDGPNGMQLIFHIGGLGTIRNEGPYLIQLCFVSGLNSWRIVEDELRVVGKGEGAGDIMEPALKEIYVRSLIGPTEM